MSDEIRIGDLTRIDVRRVVGADDDLYALTSSGSVWRHDPPGWIPLPPLAGNAHPMAPHIRAVDFYMHATLHNGNDGDTYNKFKLRVLDHFGTLWELRRIFIRTAKETTDTYIWDEVPL